jgi:hypothetical protein
MACPAQAILGHARLPPGEGNVRADPLEQGLRQHAAAARRSATTSPARRRTPEQRERDCQMARAMTISMSVNFAGPAAPRPRMIARHH